MTNILLAVGALCGLIAYLSIGVCVGNVSTDKSFRSRGLDVIAGLILWASAIAYSILTTSNIKAPSLELLLEILLPIGACIMVFFFYFDKDVRFVRTVLWPVHLLAIGLTIPIRIFGDTSKGIGGVIVWLAVGAAKLPINIGNYLTEMVKDV